MTKEQAERLNLGIPINNKTLIIIESALDLVLSKTSIKFDKNNNDDLEKVPARVKLFVVKYLELMGIQEGVASQSISNLSQSFHQNKNERFNDLLNEILGDDMISEIKFVGAVNRWE